MRGALKWVCAAGWQRFRTGVVALVTGLAAVMCGVSAQADALDWMLGLDDSGLSWSDPSVTLGWRHAVPAWAWVAIALGAAGAAWWSYHRLTGAVWARTVLASLRALLIVWLAILLAGPELVRVDERKELDTLVVMVDRSGSMNTRDMAGQGSAGKGLSRDQALRDALRTQGGVFGADRLGKDRRVLWLGFDEGAYEVSGDAARQGNLPEADGATTRLRTALEQALRLTAGQPVSGVVLMTEGRSPEATPGSLVRQLAEQEVRVYPVALGAKELPLDLTVEAVANPRGVYAGDVAPIVARIEQVGVAPGDANAIDPARVRVKLVDATTGAVLRSVSLEGRRLDEPVRLEVPTDPDQSGKVDWQVVVEVDGEALQTPAVSDAAATQGSATQTAASTAPRDPDVPVGVSPNSPELTLTNNARKVDLTVDDQPIRVLYIEGYPRWEYRYLVSMLKREASIDSSVLLRTASDSFVQEGNTSIRRAPADAEEIKPYDVIIIGDVEPEYLSESQWGLIARHVATNNAGLLWIGGSQHTPGSFVNTPLRDLLPMAQASAVDRLRFDGREITMLPTDAARLLYVMQLRDPGGAAGASDPRTAPEQQWPEGLPALEWAQNLGPLKPTAEALAVASNVILPSGDPAPLVVRMRYGSGEVLYMATDDTWRYRRGIGEHYHEQLWIQLVRMLARGRLAGGDAAARLEVDPPQMQLGSTAVVRLTVQDSELAVKVPSRVTVAVRRAGDALDTPPVETLELVREPSVADGLVRLTAQWRPTIPGDLALQVVSPELADQNLTATAEVVSDDDELRRPAADPERLAALAEGTGGQMVPLGSLKNLESLVRNLSRVTPVVVNHPVWSSWLALMVFMVLLTAEWIGRKLVQLV